MGGSYSSTSKKKVPPKGSISDVDRAVLDLKNTRDRLTRYRSKLQLDQKKLLLRAKALKDGGDERAALGLLRLRRYKIKEADNVESQLLTVLEMVDTIGSKQNEKELMGAIAVGKDALKQMHEEMSIDDVLSLMDEVTEQNEVEQQINEIIGAGSALTDTDEAEIEAELAKLEEAMLSDQQSTLPVAPSGKLPELNDTLAEDKPQKISQKRMAIPS
jgi:hypothetical protein|uniref:Charged multivesicular body protein 6 n=1 Tax=Attheya septentrionalis TaxID=420275 RepID=A0A7S2UH55_9STRA|eukprot:CAMPEP_0198298114 /NCGR_PEP_ID=MMETSP1449-20131203/39703_1 /TAXON_ID=420275 /ORGANISM="Attheya septentrionalis, Strain CCMP2084" /LENGTH=215 /DNA_ID=CAMNT_0043999297 /DNA_START=91 /DNA_END=738 /DNA_ORIENTATION=-